jgi:hypothetical protein
MSVKGTDMSEICGMNFLLKPIRPRNDRICFFVTGTGNYFPKKFILQTDASRKDMGAVLEQEFDDGRYPIVFVSKKLSEAECNNAVVEKKCFAIVWAVDFHLM